MCPKFYTSVVAGQIWGWWGVAVPGRQTPWGRRGLHLRLLRTLHAEQRGWMLICFCPLRIWSEINFGRCPRQRKRSLFWHQYNRQDNYSGFILYNTENSVPSNRNNVPKIIFRQVNLLKAGLKSTQASARRRPRESWIIWRNARSTLHLSPKNLRISKRS